MLRFVCSSYLDPRTMLWITLAATCCTFDLRSYITSPLSLTIFSKYWVKVLHSVCSISSSVCLPTPRSRKVDKVSFLISAWVAPLFKHMPGSNFYRLQLGIIIMIGTRRDGIIRCFTYRHHWGLRVFLAEASAQQVFH